jgi:hypothetical protein
MQGAASTAMASASSIIAAAFAASIDANGARSSGVKKAMLAASCYLLDFLAAAFLAGAFCLMS